MKQVVITHIGGVELAATKTIAIDPENIVATATVDGACEFTYAENDDRRDSPILYRCGNTKAQIDNYVQGTQIDFTVYDQADGSTKTLTVQEKFIEDMEAGTLWIYKTQADQTGVEVRFTRGAFLTEKIFVDGSLGDFADAALTTTTTTTAAIMKIPEMRIMRCFFFCCCH